MKLYLLGTFQAFRGDGEALVFRSGRERALLAYLAIEADHPHRRDSIGALFWPQVGEKQARNNLRVTLHRLRQALEQEEDAAGYLQASRNELKIVSDNSFFVDAKALMDAVERTNRHEHPARKTCPVCAGELEEVVDYYRGEFLKGFALEDSQPFSEWVLLKQERLHRQILRVLHDLAAYHLERGDLPSARRFANRQLELELWREEAHRQLMLILALGGERTAALAQYEICRQMLEKELGVSPSDETVALYEQIRGGESIKVEPGLPPEIPAKPVDDRGEPGPKTAKIPATRVRSAQVNWFAALVVFALIALLGWAAWIAVSRRAGLYDDFNQTSADGILDSARWIFPHNVPGESCDFVQEDGVLKFIASESLPESACALRVAPPEYVEGAELDSMSAQMRLVSPQADANFALGLRASSSFEDGDWNADCAIVSNEASHFIYFVVSDTRIREILYSSERAINPDEWYDVRLEIGPETMEVTCLLDGVEIGRFAPELPGLLLSAPFVREILTQQAPAISGEIWIDDFRLGK